MKNTNTGPRPGSELLSEVVPEDQGLVPYDLVGVSVER